MTLATRLSFEASLDVALDETAIKAALAPMFADNVELAITDASQPTVDLARIDVEEENWERVPAGPLKVSGIAARPPRQNIHVGWSDDAITEALADLVEYRDQNEYPPLTHSQTLACAIDCLRAVLGQVRP